MTEGNLARDPEEPAGPLFPGLAGRLLGTSTVTTTGARGKRPSRV